MNPQSAFNFHWLSPLGISVVLFLLYGALYVLIGVLTPWGMNSATGRTMLIISPRADEVVFGQKPVQLLQADPRIYQLRTILLLVIGGLLVAAGCFHITITWFGLRNGQTWALAALTLGGVVVLPFWLLALQPYFQKDVSLTLGDIPPFMWIPAALLVPAVVLGWIGLR